MIILGIEGTAHTLGMGVIEVYKDSKIRIISNEKDSFSSFQGGMIPSQIADHHVSRLEETTKKVLSESNLTIYDIDLIAYSKGPGFGSALNVISAFSHALSKKYNIPVIGVHHGTGHIFIAKYLLNINDAIYLYVSGGNTQIVSYEKNNFVVWGETQDIAIGNALDKLARAMGYGFPGGKIIEELGKRGEYFEMPYTVKGMDVAFSGILTYAIRSLREHRTEDVAFSFQEHAFSMLTESVERAIAYTNKKEVCIVGGVGVNNVLQNKVKLMSRDRNIKYYRLDNTYLGDNGAMIAVAGYHYYKYYNVDFFYNKDNILSRWRIEDAFRF